MQQLINEIVALMKGDPYRRSLHGYHRAGEWLAVSDGHVAAFWRPDDPAVTCDPAPADAKPPNFAAVMLSADAQTVAGFPVAEFMAWLGPEPEPRPCSKCHGKRESDCETCYGIGTHTCGRCEDEHDCGHCDGTGVAECDQCKDGTESRVIEPVAISGLPCTFDAYLLRRTLRHWAAATAEVAVTGSMLHLLLPDYRVVVMGLNGVPEKRTFAWRTTADARE